MADDDERRGCPRFPDSQPVLSIDFWPLSSRECSLDGLTAQLLLIWLPPEGAGIVGLVRLSESQSHRGLSKHSTRTTSVCSMPWAMARNKVRIKIGGVGEAGSGLGWVGAGVDLGRDQDHIFTTSGVVASQRQAAGKCQLDNLPSSDRYSFPSPMSYQSLRYRR